MTKHKNPLERALDGLAESRAELDRLREILISVREELTVAATGIPNGKVLIDQKELDGLNRELDDYVHYAESYGNMSGTCSTGYPQHPGYICARCGVDRSERGAKCGRKK